MSFALIPRPIEVRTDTDEWGRVWQQHALVAVSWRPTQVMLALVRSLPLMPDSPQHTAEIGTAPAWLVPEDQGTDFRWPSEYRWPL